MHRQATQPLSRMPAGACVAYLELRLHAEWRLYNMALPSELTRKACGQCSLLKKCWKYGLYLASVVECKPALKFWRLL